MLAPLVAVPSAFAVSGWLIHRRGRERLAPLRQVSDHSTFTAPYNLAVYAAAKVPADPYLDPCQFPALRLLIEAWETIRDEGLALREQGGIRAATGDNDLGFHTFFKRGWTRFYLTWYGETPASARRTCPRTVALLESIPEIKGAMFAVLPAGALLGRHRDPFAGSLRLHLGLATPNDDRCWIAVDGVRRSWRDGEAMLFDETYVHEARNETDRDRLILLADVERPLVEPMRTVNRWVMGAVMRQTVTQNEAGEPVGLLNRAFGPVYALLKLGKPLKARNRKLYYTLKRVVTAAVAIGWAAAVATRLGSGGAGRRSEPPRRDPPRPLFRQSF